MEAINILKGFLQHINAVVLVLVLLGGLFAKNYLSALNWPVALKTLAVSTIFVIAYIVVLIISGQMDKNGLPDFLVTYCFATSLYELLLKYALDFITEKLKTK